MVKSMCLVWQGQQSSPWQHLLTHCGAVRTQPGVGWDHPLVPAQRLAEGAAGPPLCPVWGTGLFWETHSRAHICQWLRFVCCWQNIPHFCLPVKLLVSVQGKFDINKWSNPASWPTFPVFSLSVREGISFCTYPGNSEKVGMDYWRPCWRLYERQVWKIHSMGMSIS